MGKDRHGETEKWSSSRKNWDSLPLLSKGESKEIRIIDDDTVIVRLIPSLYSFSKNRSETIIGTDLLRLRSSEILTTLLRGSGLAVSALAFGDDYYVTRRLKFQGKDSVPPIEVIVKGRHVGTPKHALYRISDYPTVSGNPIRPDRAHLPYVRFDYTNPLHDSDGKRLRDECIPGRLADRYIDTWAAEYTALASFTVLFGYLSARGIRLDDICFKIDHSGSSIFGELSPDCMRAVWVGQDEDFFDSVGMDTSKDTFRSGSSPEVVLERYTKFSDIIAGAPIRSPLSPFDAERHLSDAM